MSKMARRGLKRKPGVGATGREVAPFAMHSRYSRTLDRSRAQDANLGPWNQQVNHKSWSRKGGGKLYRRASFGARKGGRCRSRGVAAKQGFIMYYTKGVAIGTEVSVRYRESGRLSGVVEEGFHLGFHQGCS